MIKSSHEVQRFLRLVPCCRYILAMSSRRCRRLIKRGHLTGASEENIAAVETAFDFAFLMWTKTDCRGDEMRSVCVRVSVVVRPPARLSD